MTSLCTVVKSFCRLPSDPGSAHDTARDVAVVIGCGLPPHDFDMLVLNLDCAAQGDVEESA